MFGKWLLLLAVSAPLLGDGGEWALREAEVLLPADKNIIHLVAAEELAKHLRLIGGHSGKVARKAERGSKNLKFIIGAPPPEKTVPLKKLEARYAVRGDTVYIWGDDSKLKPDVEMATIFSRAVRCGTLSGVYAFLEEKLECRWLRPGDSGIACPSRLVVSLPEQEDYAWNPSFEMVSVRGYWWSDAEQMNLYAPEKLRSSPEEIAKHKFDNSLWLCRMRHGTRTVIRYGHAFTQWWELYGKEHPEYFGMNPYGTRIPAKGFEKTVKLCVSNPAVVDRIIAEWEKAGKPEYWNICPNDGTPGFCFCPNCLALDTRTEQENFYDHLTDRYLNFWNRIVEKAVKLRPDVKLVTYVYSYYRHLPRREKIAYPDNMLLGIVPALFEDNEAMLQGWREVGMKHVFIRPNDLCTYNAFFRGMEKRIYDKFQQSRQFELFGTDYDGGLGARTIDLEYYIASRMVAFPDKSFEELENEYYATFGAAAPEVREFYLFQRRIGERNLAGVKEHLKQTKQDLLDDGEIGRVILGGGRGYSRAEMEEAAAILKKGLGKNLSEAERFRLEELSIIQEHASLTLAFISEALAFQNGKPNELESVSRKLTDYRIQYRDRIGWKWGELYNREEKRFWASVKWYQNEVLKSKTDFEQPDMLFRSSFDLPSMEGWQARERFVEITGQTASFDKFSIKMAADAAPGVGIFRNQVAVVPGQRYHVSCDAKIDEGVDHVRLKVAGGGKTLTNLILKRQGGNWDAAGTAFTVPDGVDSIILYVLVGPGEKGRFAYVDNIVLRKANGEAQP